MKDLIGDMVARSSFNLDNIRQAFETICQQKANKVEMAAFLTILKLKEWERHPDILAHASSIIRKFAVKMAVPIYDDWVDIVGMGGDGYHTFNVSTAASIIAGSCGCRVAKHGNRASTSKSGSADFLEALDVDINSLKGDKLANLLKSQNFNFLFSPIFYPVLVKVKEVRKELGFPTIFNILGPLLNPLNPKYTCIGVNQKDLAPVVIDALRMNGIKRAFVVHGEEGLDEISPAGKTYVWELQNGVCRSSVVTPEDFGVEPFGLDKVKGGTAEENADMFLNVLKGELKGPVLDFTVMNTAPILYVRGYADSLKEASDQARQKIESGEALEFFNNFINAVKIL